MIQPLQITFRHMPPSPSVEQTIRKRVAELDRFYPGIVSCHVVFEQAHHHQRHGGLFHVRADLHVPGGSVVVGHAEQDAHEHEDAYVAIHDAFDALRRRLEDFSRKQNGQVKVHAQPTELGAVRVLLAYEGYGFIEAQDHSDVYFHKNAVLKGAFAALEVGDRVRFVRNDGESLKGPQASSVELISSARSSMEQSRQTDR